MTTQARYVVVMAVMVWVSVEIATSCQPASLFQGPTPIDHPVPTASGPPPPLTDDPRSQLDRLHADLDQRRAALALPPPRPAAEDPCAPVCTIDDPPAMPSRTAGCTPGAGSACAAACTQADAACDDASKICAIAKDLRTEAWASDQCREASATCANAHAPCCGCNG